MAVDVPNLPELRMGTIDHRLERLVVWPPARFEPMIYLVVREFAVVDRRAIVHHAPDQTLAEPQFRGIRQGVRPRRVEQLRVYLFFAAIGVDIAARESCRQ